MLSADEPSADEPSADVRRRCHTEKEAVKFHACRRGEREGGTIRIRLVRAAAAEAACSGTASATLAASRRRPPGAVPTRRSLLRASGQTLLGILVLVLAMAPTSRAKAAPPVIANAAQAAATTTLWLTGASSLPSLVRRDLGRRVDPDGSTGRAAATGASPLEGDTVVWVDEVMWVSEVAGAPGPEVDFAVATAQAAESLAFSIAVTEADAAVVGIPRTVLAAYRRAEVLLAESAPGCHLPWWLVAGIGRVESGHAWGGRVDAVGTTRGRILGIRLDGSVSGTAVIRDSDGGSLDGDTLFDRAVGPMQFLPASWRGIARDGNGDKVLNPHNIFDAAATAGAYLCRAGGDLRVPADLARAVLAYNRSGTYLTAVLSWGSRYRSGAWELPDSTGGIPTAPTTAQTTPAPAPSAPVPTTPVPSAPVPTTPVPTTPAPTTPAPTTPTTSTSTFTPTGSATATATDPPTATAPLTSGERG